MASRSDDLMKRVNDLWRQAVTQLEDVRDILSERLEGRIESDSQKLKLERDRLLLRLGEETYKLANQGRLPMPSIVRRQVDKLNDVIDRLVETESAEAEAQKPAAQKAPEEPPAPVGEKASPAAPAAEQTPRKTSKKASKAPRKKSGTKNKTAPTGQSTATKKKTGKTTKKKAKTGKKTSKKSTKKPSKSAD